MEQEVKQAVYMGIQLLITAVIIATISMAIYIGKSLMHARDQEIYAGNIIREQALFNDYMQEQGNIAGSDVVDIIITYAKIYDFVVVDRSSGSPNIVHVWKSSDSIDTYNTNQVVTNIKAKLFERFKMKQICTSDGGAIIGLVFTTGGTADCTEEEIQKIAKNTLGIELPVHVR